MECTLPDQVNEYDTARIKVDVENIQFSLFVTNENCYRMALSAVRRILRRTADLCRAPAEIYAGGKDRR